MAGSSFSPSLADHPRIREEHARSSGAPPRTQGSSPHTRGALLFDRPLIHRRRIIPAYAGSTPGTRTDHLGYVGSSPHTRGARQRIGGRLPSARIIPAYAGSTAPWTTANCPPGDHPRIRGEHLRRAAGRRRAGGSSPHTRGARPDGAALLLGGGIIPAYAGSTPSTSGQVGGDADHPRIRGEHNVASCPHMTRAGSSPHTRGAPSQLVDESARPRIIPAYAGSTCISRRRGARKWDHPRIRGEHISDGSTANMRGGSSPHTRGARVQFYGTQRGDGIIPAYAGSTHLSIPRRALMTDHPRIRGEHLMKYGLVIEAAGSSPHTRGAPLRPVPESLCRRIIPAYAGSTVRIQIGGFDFEDHPRIRGEHVMVTGCSLGAAGSSPHTRGARDLDPRAGPAGRIIPAYAGSTWSSSSRMVVVRDHPRIRGEHDVAAPHRRARLGSSPHTRGALIRGAGRVVGDRIIPAYAGSTIVEEETGRKPIGSSPHTRGARRRLHRLRPRYRIIPAYAGSTVPVGYVVQDRGDHPRIRGEHPSSTTSWTTSGRIIPAYAGSTPGGRLPFRGVADHPRIRGEHVLLGGSH